MGKAWDALGEAVWRVFQNRKSTLTALGLVSVCVAVISKNHPNWQMAGEAGTLLTAAIKFLSTDDTYPTR